MKSDHIPTDATVAPTSQARQFPNVAQKGLGGAFHIVNQDQPAPQRARQAQSTSLIQREPNGAFFLSNQ